MILKTFVEPPLDNNNYLLINEDIKEAILIDCSHFDTKITGVLKEYSAKLKYILLTHAHFDHILGVEKMVEATGAKVILGIEDENLLANLNSYAYMLGLREVNIPAVDKFITDGEKINWGSSGIKIIHLPGHTKGGTGFLVNDILFSGDTLFKESVGRTDLEGGNFNELQDSIKNKIFMLPDETIVYPGHGPQTSVGHEKRYNSYV